jgi:hypothetical protein
MSEWELLCDSDGIKAGDDVIVETDDGRVYTLRVLRWTSKSVWLRDVDREVNFRFSTETLESADGYASIQCKA